MAKFVVIWKQGNTKGREPGTVELIEADDWGQMSVNLGFARGWRDASKELNFIRLEPGDKVFRVEWLNKTKPTIINGKDKADAFNRNGLRGGAINAVDVVTEISFG